MMSEATRRRRNRLLEMTETDDELVVALAGFDLGYRCGREDRVVESAVAGRGAGEGVDDPRPTPGNAGQGAHRHSGGNRGD
jgi:hypothetical protein